MNHPVSRRTFFKLIPAGALASLAFRPLADLSSELVVRVGSHAVDVHAQPDEASEVLGRRRRDELINVYEEIDSPAGPAHNPRWYRVWGGYVHSARLQIVTTRLNRAVEALPKGGQLAEVTVPYTQSLRWVAARKAWEPLYRLYYESLHWVTAVEPGPDGQPWYRIHDELTEMKYHVIAAHLRLVAAEEFAPISPDLDPWKKRIHVSIGGQVLRAYEDEQLVLETPVSTGVGNWRNDPNLLSTETPLGDFNILSKMPSKHMGDGGITADIEAYELPGVPWTSFFTTSGHAIHGTYWHQNYGVRMSHGCVNVPTAVARWIFRWSTPVSAAGTWEQRGRGTRVQVTG